MCTIHILHHETAQENTSALSHFFIEFSANESIFWWESRQPSVGYSIPDWCDTHISTLQEELSTLMHDLAFMPVQGKELQAWFTAGDELSHWYASLLYEKHPKMLPMLYTACKLRALECMIAQYAPTCSHVTLHFSHPVLHAALQEYCYRTGKKYTYKPPKVTAFHRIKKVFRGVCMLQNLSIKKCFAFLPYFVQAGVRFLHWLWMMRRVLFAKKTFFTSQTASPATVHASIATYFPHFHKDAAQNIEFRSHYFENLHDILQEHLEKKELHVHWVFVRVQSAQASLSESITLKERLQSKAIQEGNAQSFHYMEEYLRLCDYPLALIRYIRLAWRSQRIQRDVAPYFRLGQGHIPLWLCLKEAWKESFQGWRCLERCLQRRAFVAYAQAFSKNIPPASQKISSRAWSLFVWENCPWERFFTEAMHDALPHAPVYAMQHSCVREADFRYYDDRRLFSATQSDVIKRMLADTYCLNGAHALQLLQKNLPAKKCVHVEALRYMYLQNMPQLPVCTSCTHLVLMTSYFPHEIDTQLRVLAQYVQSSQYHEQPLHIHIKAHPHTPVHNFLKKYHLTAQTITYHTGTMQELWQCVHMWHNQGEGSFFWLANSTTVCLEAAYMQIPFCVHGAENDFSLCPLHGVQGLIYVHTGQDIHNVLQKYESISLEKKIFTLDRALNAWKSLLGIA